MTVTGENRRNRRKTCPSTTLFIINPTKTALEANSGICGGKPATNRLSYGKAVGLALKAYSAKVLPAFKETAVSFRVGKTSHWSLFWATSVQMMAVFWPDASCSLTETDKRFGGAYCLYYQGALMMEAVHTFETLVNMHLTTRQYIPEDSKLQFNSFHTPYRITARFMLIFSSRVL
jgi:hypothetical protein